MNQIARIAASPDPDAFLAWAHGRPGRFELVGGKTVTMTGASRNHATVMARICGHLLAATDQNAYRIAVADLGVRTPAGIRYPDAVVDRWAGSGTELAAEAPPFIAEILSPSSVSVDMIEKAAEYTALPSLAVYAAFSQDEPVACIWRRGEAGFSAVPEQIEGRDGLAGARRDAAVRRTLPGHRPLRPICATGPRAWPACRPSGP